MKRIFKTLGLCLLAICLSAAAAVVVSGCDALGGGGGTTKLDFYATDNATINFTHGESGDATSTLDQSTHPVVPAESEG